VILGDGDGEAGRLGAGRLRHRAKESAPMGGARAKALATAAGVCRRSCDLFGR
jgi:hypothetical protein